MKRVGIFVSGSQRRFFHVFFSVNFSLENVKESNQISLEVKILKPKLTFSFLFRLVRFLMGLFEAVTFPSFNAMLGRWVPVFEKSVFSALALSGGVCGNVVFQIIMGYICSYEAIGMLKLLSLS